MRATLKLQVLESPFATAKGDHSVWNGDGAASRYERVGAGSFGTVAIAAQYGHYCNLHR